MATGTNGTNGIHSPDLSHSPTRASLDSEQSAISSCSLPPPLPNGHTSRVDGLDDDDDEPQTMDELKRELQNTREEKETLATQYRNLLAKLTAMRTTLGNKLKQDAEELDRRETQIQSLSTQNEDLLSMVETIKSELFSSNAEAERLSCELANLRSRSLKDNEHASSVSTKREREMREMQLELEKFKAERDDWENAAAKNKVELDETRSLVEVCERELVIEKERRERDKVELDAQKERADNLQAVLGDFQTERERELNQVVSSYESRLTVITQSLAEFKHRALTAEMTLEESQTDTTKYQAFEKEVKEKNLLIGKLRHEAVIINEHLMEALRRLRRSHSSTNVDKRLVTNFLLSFLSTPRADPKRFEMLSLLASVLGWNDAEREKAGLQRVGSGGTPGGMSPGASPSGGGGFWSRTPSQQTKELEKTDETESFSRLWVEFLLTEAASGSSDASPSPSPSHMTRALSPPGNVSLPASPTTGTSPLRLSNSGSPPRGGRLNLFGGSPGAMASSPSLDVRKL